MPELLITRGLPGSGKTYFAHDWISLNAEGRARVNRDELRSNLFPAGGPVLSYKEENLISKVQREAVTALLRSGRSVIVDDTHLRAKYVLEWKKLAEKWGVSFSVVDFTHVDIEVCIARDASRAASGGRGVGEEAIRSMARRLASMPPLDLEAGQAAASEWVYEPDENAPKAWIFDIDGTIALHNGRSPYDWTRVEEDVVNAPVRVILNLYLVLGFDIILVSGRDAACRPQTEAWLDEHKIVYRELYMRPEGDTRNDAIVKLEIFRDEIAPRFHVLGVYDDRDRVVEMWRSIGLLCCQVAPGDF